MATAKAIPDAVSAQALSESESDQSDGEDVTVIPETPLQSESEDEEGVDLLRVGVCIAGERQAPPRLWTLARPVSSIFGLYCRSLTLL